MCDLKRSLIAAGFSGNSGESPEIVVDLASEGRLCFFPTTDMSVKP